MSSHLSVSYKKTFRLKHTKLKFYPLLSMCMSMVSRPKRRAMIESEKMAVFWVVAPCSLVEVYQCFGGPCCLHRPDDGGSKDL
jgi:hypothetical protein